MKTKLLLGLGLLSISFMADASGKMEFTLANASPFSTSVEVGRGYVSYAYVSMSGSLPAGCPTSDHPAFVRLSDLIALPLVLGKVRRTVTFTPPDLDVCMRAGGKDNAPWAAIVLTITKVNNIYSKNSCAAEGILQSSHDFAKATPMNIQATEDAFTCI